MEKNEDIVFEHAWNYFEKHSTQRVSFFNFYIIIMGASATAIGVLFKTKELFFFGILLGVFIVITTFIFWKIDQRTSFLTKHAEKVLAKIEKKFIDEYQIFSSEEKELENFNQNINFTKKIMTYGQLFRIIYIFIGSIGFLNIFYFLFKLVLK